MEHIKQQLDSLISYGTNISNPHTDDVFNAWKENKKDFVRMFDGNLIYEYGEISLHLSPEEKRKKVYELANRVAYTYGNIDLAKFIEVNVNSFFDNKVSDTYNGVDIPIGMKLLKAFKYYENSETILRKVQDEASMLIQEDKITGTLCFSVHPLDFMSSSENTYNWRSCHALDGEYAAGNLSYMGDHSTIICYLKGKDDVILPNFNMPWNDKKWRMLIHFSENRDMIFAGRQYPFFSEEIFCYLDDAFDKMGLPTQRDFTNWRNKIIKDADLYEKYVAIYHVLYPMSQIVKDVSKLHYNDLIYSTCYTPWFIYNYRVCCRWDETGEKAYLPEFKIGYEVKCLKCGERYLDPGGEGRFRCYACYDNDNYGDDAYYCDCCGCRIDYDEETWVHNESAVVCPHCLNHETFTCGYCNEIYFTSDAVYIEQDNKYACPHCVTQMDEAKTYNQV